MVVGDMSKTSIISNMPRGGGSRYTLRRLPHASLFWLEGTKDPAASMAQSRRHGMSTELTRLDFLSRLDTWACCSMGRLEVSLDLRSCRQFHLGEGKRGWREVAGLSNREEQALRVSVRRSRCVAAAGDGRFVASAALTSVEKERRRRSVS